jgi:hypothetical protein
MEPVLGRGRVDELVSRIQKIEELASVRNLTELLARA